VIKAEHHRRTYPPGTKCLRASGTQRPTTLLAGPVSSTSFFFTSIVAAVLGARRCAAFGATVA
jgi:hypothetical protein